MINTLSILIPTYNNVCIELVKSLQAQASLLSSSSETRSSSQESSSCFEYEILVADDTGLEVEALDGAPGVHSARYAEGTDHDSEANMAKLLRELNGKENRKARFRTVICYIEKKDVCPCGCTSIKKIHQFDGIVNGSIATEKHGTEGFGYDPIFVPEGYDLSFAQLGEEIKNGISHRARAVAKLAEYLKNKND